jgi:hypothetical protein
MKHADLMRASVPVALAAAFALTACNPPHPRPPPPLRAVSTLDCPETQGDLTRKSAAPDGKSCVYADADGDQVTLQLLGLDGKDLRTAMAPIEAQLLTEVPAASEKPAPASPANPHAPGAATPGAKDRVDIDLPGVHIHTSADGHAKVDAQGVHVDAHDDDGHDGDRHDHDRADVRIGGAGAGVTINANDGGAQVRVDEKGTGLRARYILASESPGPHGFTTGWYEARGPVGGPVAVAVVLSKSHDDEDKRHDVRQLLKRNVGG